MAANSSRSPHQSLQFSRGDVVALALLSALPFLLAQSGIILQFIDILMLEQPLHLKQPLGILTGVVA
ncbi:hypothetical protein LguiB_017933 [Lonicera macranthoides]